MSAGSLLVVFIASLFIVVGVNRIWMAKSGVLVASGALFVVLGGVLVALLKATS